MRDRLIALREDALAAAARARGGHGQSPAVELWVCLACLIERILAAGLC